METLLALSRILPSYFLLQSNGERILTGGPGPVQLVERILEEATKSGVSQTRRCIKFIPVMYSCATSLAAIKKQAHLVAAEFGDSGKTYYFNVRCREEIPNSQE